VGSGRNECVVGALCQPPLPSDQEFPDARRLLVTTLASSPRTGPAPLGEVSLSGTVTDFYLGYTTLIISIWWNCKEYGSCGPPNYTTSVSYRSFGPREPTVTPFSTTVPAGTYSVPGTIYYPFVTASRSGRPGFAGYRTSVRVDCSGIFLTVTKTGTGSGTVTSSPSGISCGADCSAPYALGTSVTLTAAPASGSTFGSWAGCDSVSGLSCTVTMNTDRSVTATFIGTGTECQTCSPSGAIQCDTTTVNQPRDFLKCVQDPVTGCTSWQPQPPGSNATCSQTQFCCAANELCREGTTTDECVRLPDWKEIPPTSLLAPFRAIADLFGRFFVALAGR
jgi:hypothetical protein